MLSEVNSNVGGEREKVDGTKWIYTVTETLTLSADVPNQRLTRIQMFA